MTIQRTLELHLKQIDQGEVGDIIRDNVDAGLFWMGENQRVVSLPVPGCMTGAMPTKDQIRTYGLAMMIEMGEFIQELDWKPWKDKAVDNAKAAEEFADILAFMGVMVAYLEDMGITSRDLAEAYRCKSVKNIQRFLGQHEGYKDLTEGEK